MMDLLDNINECLIIFNSDKKVEYVNNSAKEKFDLDVGDDVGKIFREDDKVVMLESVLDLVRKGRLYRDLLRVLDKDRDEFFVWVSFFSWQEKYVLEIFDLKPIIKRMESITDSSYVRILKYMSTGISHSIRNPIMSAGGLLARIKGMIKNSNVENSEKLAKYIESVEKSLFRIISIIANIEVISNSFPVKLERINVGDEINSIVKKFSDRNINFTLNIDSDVWVYIDKMHFGFMIEEIIKNAMDALEGVKDPEISINVYTDKINAYIEIVDNGLGIKDENLPLTTIPFYSTKPSNMGIGLSLIKFLIEGYHGNIEIDSKEGSGTKVVLILPTERKEDLKVNTDV